MRSPPSRFLPLALAATALAAPTGAQAMGRAPAAKPRPDLTTRAPGPAATRAASSKATLAARSQLQRSLGPAGVLDVDRVTGTVRSLAKLDGSLTGASTDGVAQIVKGYARANAAALGITAADVDALGAAEVVKAPGGIGVVRLPQEVDGIPVVDAGLRGAVDGEGRLVSLTGAPVRGLALDSTKPGLTASDALRVVAESVGATAVPAVSSPASGTRQRTGFASGDMGRLVVWTGGTAPRLAWHVTYKAGAKGWWDAIVDAQDGTLLRRTSLVDHAASASYYQRYPGFNSTLAGNPDSATTVDLEAKGWLAAAAPKLDGPNAHAYSDVDGGDDADPSEEVGRTSATAFGYTLTPFNAGQDAAFPNQCNSAVLANLAFCTWNDLQPTSWTTNRQETTLQTFVFNNVFHDHLKAAPIGFDAASGNFEGADKVLSEADDGAARTVDGGTAVDPDYLNNANMGTPPDGQSPTMQMYLGSIHQEGLEGLFRNNNNGEDAATVYHEYTHGLSNRLVTDDDGAGALGSAQSGAMGEAWSDWYAFDFLNRQTPSLAPDSGAPGEIDLGDFTDYTPNAVRTQPLDCPVANPGDPGYATIAAACPGTVDYSDEFPGAGPGGYTYGDLGKIYGEPEVHGDGEIWGETLWDLRTALVAAKGGSAEAGSTAAEAIVTTGMRLSPPEPSFLEMRNAILSADQAVNAGANYALIWSVFAKRGMGYFASSQSSQDTAPVEDFTLPPAANTPTGVATGRITDQTTGAPIAGIEVSSGLFAVPGGAATATTTDADGRWSLTLPVHTYPSLSVREAKPSGYLILEPIKDVAVTAGATVTKDLTLRRTIAFGKAVTTNNDTGGKYSCGVGGLNDATLGKVWEVDLNDAAGQQPPTATIDLGAVQDVSSYGLDPGEGCGSSASAATKGYKLESSADGVTFTTVKQGEFTPADTHRLNEVVPGVGAKQARYVRLTLLSQQGADYDYRDFAELAVFAPAPVVAPPPTTTTTPATTVITPPIVPPVVRPVAPTVKLLKSKPGQARVQVTCAGSCKVRGVLSTSSKVRKKARLKTATLTSSTRTFSGKRTLTYKLSKKERRALRRRARQKRPSLTLKLTITPSGGTALKRTLKARVPV